MKHLLLPMLLCCVLRLSAQHPLTSSPVTSAFTYVYKIPDDQLLSVYKTGAFRKAIFTHLIDSFPTGNEQTYTPPPGNYLYVTAEGNMLKPEIKCSPTAYLFIVNGPDGYMPVIQNKNGEVVQDAIVKKKGKVLIVTYQGVLHIFHFEQKKFRYKQHKPASYKGYIAFSQPIYQPNDTVKLKAFITGLKDEPINEPLQVRLRTEDRQTDTILTTLYPYRPGAYVYQFVMPDSMPADKTYSILLEQHGEVRRQENFRFERYELQQIDLDVAVNTGVHQRHEPVILNITTAEGKRDTRLKICITTHTPRSYHAQEVFVPDTLWQQVMVPAADGHTSIQLPDSIFPAAAFTYTIHCQLWNSNNQSVTKTLVQEYTDTVKQLYIQQENDSIYIDMLVAGQPAKDTGTLYVYDATHALVKSIPISMPMVFKQPSFARQYIVKSGTQDEMHYPDLNIGISCNSRHTADSAYFDVINPHQFPFWYSIYNKKNKVFATGYTQSLQWQHAATPAEDYYLRIHHISQNEMTSQVFTAHYDVHQLQVAIHAPDTITSGQTTQIQIAVTDQDDHPVSNADVTAYGLNSQFKDAVPYIPSYSTTDDGPDHLQVETSPFFPDVHPLLLDYNYWQSRMRLDTIPWFRFSHPAPVFRVEEPAIDSVTQIAPFVFSNGYATNCQIIYIDKIPVYYRPAAQQAPYSFRTTPGMHQLQIRTDRMLITYDSMLVHKGVKNIISIDPQQGIKVEKRKKFLTKEEVAILNRYMDAVSTTTQLYDDGELNNLDDQVVLPAKIKKPFLHPQYGYQSPGDPGIGQLAIDVLPDTLSPAYIVLHRYDDTSYTRTYSGLTSTIAGLDTGKYQLLFIYKDRYFIQDSVHVKSGGITFNKRQHIHWQYGTIQDHVTAGNDTTLTRIITGTVVDREGFPESDITVSLPGTAQSTVTDMQGQFRLSVPDQGMLCFAGSNYDTVYLPLTQRKEYYIGLQTIPWHGINNLNWIPLLKRNNSTVVTFSFVEDRRGEKVEVPGPPMHTPFREDAFWQPTLYTDANGIATCYVRFPDNIANWRIHALCMTGQQQSGKAVKHIMKKRSIR